MTKRIEHVFEDNVEKKWCGKCKQFNPLENYGNSKQTWDKLRSTCKNCLKEENKKNKEKITEYNKNYWKNTKEQQTERHKVWVEQNKEHVKQKSKEYRLKHGKEIDKKTWQKRKNDPEYREKHNAYIREWCKQKRKNDTEYKIKQNCRRRIREMLNNDNASGKTLSSEKYTGCSTYQLQCHLERKFKDGMTWNNYGKAWHIDHIIPCASFNMNKAIDVMACFHYTNLQPLWSNENIKKSDNYNDEEKNAYMRRFKEFVFMM